RSSSLGPEDVPDRLKQRITLDRLSEIAGRTERHALFARAGLVVGRNYDDRGPSAQRQEPFLHFETGHERHLQVENDAVGAVVRQGGEELRAGSERRGAKVRRLQEAHESPPDRGFVVYDGYER